MSVSTLQAKKRDKKVSNNSLREDRQIPAVLYGHKVENQLISVPLSAFVKVYKNAGENTLVDLTIDKEKPVKVLIHDLSRDVETHEVEHVDFYQVNMNEKIQTVIPVVFTGVAPAVKTLGGVLITQIEAIPVKCLPGDLVDNFTIDLGVLTDFTKRITVGDLNIPDTIEVLRDMEDNVVLVSAPRVATKAEIEEEEAEAAAAAESSEASAEKGLDESADDAKGENAQKEEAQ